MSDLVRDYSNKVKDLRFRNTAEKFPLDDEDKALLKRAEERNGKPCTLVYMGENGLLRCMTCGGIMMWHGMATCGDCGRAGIYK